MDKHDRTGNHPRILEGLPELEVFVVFETDAPKDDHIRIGVHADAGQQFIVRLSGGGEDGQFLALDQRIEDIHHRNACLDEPAGNDPPYRVDRRPPDVHSGQGRQLGTIVDRFPRAVENAPEKGIAESHLHRVPQKPHQVACRDPARPGKHLKENIVPLETDDLSQGQPVTAFHGRQFPIGNPVRRHRDDVPLDSADVRVFQNHEQITPFPARTASISPRYLW